MKKNSVLFWPGRGKSADILSRFISVMNENGYDFYTIPFDYDNGETPFKNGSEWMAWLSENRFAWWIGISLGASLAYTFAALLDKTKKPERLTLINPFSSREILSREKEFSLLGQWNFSPIDYILNVKNIEMVISEHDEKIPLHHGISLINNASAINKKLIFVNADHQIRVGAAQSELAALLLDGIERKGNNRGTHYCNVYSQ